MLRSAPDLDARIARPVVRKQDEIVRPVLVVPEVVLPPTVYKRSTNARRCSEYPLVYCRSKVHHDIHVVQIARRRKACSNADRLDVQNE